MVPVISFLHKKKKQLRGKNNYTPLMPPFWLTLFQIHNLKSTKQDLTFPSHFNRNVLVLHNHYQSA